MGSDAWILLLLFLLVLGLLAWQGRTQVGVVNSQ